MGVSRLVSRSQLQMAAEVQVIINEVDARAIKLTKPQKRVANELSNTVQLIIEE